MLVNGGATIKSMSAAFMADVERAVTRTSGPYSEKMKRMSGNSTSVPVTKGLKRHCAAHGRQRKVHRGKLKRLGSFLPS